MSMLAVRHRSSRRDRVADMAAVVLAVVLAEPLRRAAYDGIPSAPTGAWAVLDLVLGVLAALALWERRRRPVELVAVLAPLTIVSQAASAAALIALFTLALHRPARLALAAVAWYAATVAVWVALHPDPSLGGGLVVLAATGFCALVAVAGQLLRRRRARIAAGLRVWRIPARVRGGRGRRDLAVDAIAVLLALALAEPLRLIAYDGVVSPPGGSWPWIDLALGLALAPTVWWRRRSPVQLAVGLAAVTVVSQATGAAAAILLFTVAVHRPLKVVVPVAVWQVATYAIWIAMYPSVELDFWFNVLIGTLMTAVVIAWGMYIRSRRELVASLRERAERAEAEQAMRAEQARVAERTRIAREMHDVLAHRVSLIALHAGALELDESGDPERRRTAELIRSTARLALEDLRGVIGVLRAGGSAEVVPEAPQPTLRDLVRLVDDARRSGQRVELELALEDPGAAPDTIGRDAYRIVQEALTNARKHARGTPATVHVSGAPGEGLWIEVRNRLPLHAGATAGLPDSGFGLVGLAERVELAGGTIDHGPVGDAFVVRARLGWDAGTDHG